MLGTSDAPKQPKLTHVSLISEPFNLIIQSMHPLRFRVYTGHIVFMIRDAESYPGHWDIYCIRA